MSHGLPREPSSAPLASPAASPAASAADVAVGHRLGRALAFGTALLVAAPVVTIHRHIPDSLPILGTVAFALGWIAFANADPRRALSMGGLWLLVFAIGAGACAVVYHQRQLENRRGDLARLAEELDEEWEPPDLGDLPDRARLGDPLAVRRLIEHVRSGRVGSIQADEILGRVGLGGAAAPARPARRGGGLVAVERRSGLRASLDDGGELGRILARLRPLWRLRAELVAWRRTRNVELASLAGAALVYDGSRWARAVDGRADDGFPWIAGGRILPGSSFYDDWLERLSAASPRDPLEIALVSWLRGRPDDPRFGMRTARDAARAAGDAAGEAVATFWSLVIAHRTRERRVPPEQLEAIVAIEEAPPWVRTAAKAQAAILRSDEADPISAADLARQDAALLALRRECLAEHERSATTLARAARPEAVVLVELAAILGACTADEALVTSAIEALKLVRPHSETRTKAHAALDAERARRRDRRSGD